MPPAQSVSDHLNLKDPSTYRHWVPVTIRYSDQDPLGHVNNAVYVTWVEACRVSYIGPLMPPDGSLDFVLVNQSIDYYRECRFPGEVQVGGRIVGLGNTSFHTAWGVFKDEECLAAATCVNVFFDLRERCPTPPSATLRRSLEAALA